MLGIDQNQPNGCNPLGKEKGRKIEDTTQPLKMRKAFRTIFFISSSGVENSRIKMIITCAGRALCLVQAATQCQSATMPQTSRV